jgi:hypothetical protein
MTSARRRHIGGMRDGEPVAFMIRIGVDRGIGADGVLPDLTTAATVALRTRAQIARLE